jgi:hypothetical protein
VAVFLHRGIGRRLPSTKEEIKKQHKDTETSYEKVGSFSSPLQRHAIGNDGSGRSLLHSLEE